MKKLFELEDGINLIDGELILRMKPFHEQVIPHYPIYDPDKPAPGVVTSYSSALNVCGHTQRAFLCYWALRAFIEHGVISLELGSAGCVTPMALSLDIVGNGEAPQYGGSPMQGVHFKGDGSDLSMFGTGSFSAVLSSHVIEHTPKCRHLRGGESPQQKMLINCPGLELLPVFREQWLRVIRPGGYFCAIFPEEGAARKAGHSVFYEDNFHQHAILAERFYSDIVAPLVKEGLIELIQFNTFQNGFSCDMVLRRL